MVLDQTVFKDIQAWNFPLISNEADTSDGHSIYLDDSRIKLDLSVNQEVMNESVALYDQKINKQNHDKEQEKNQLLQDELAKKIQLFSTVLDKLQQPLFILNEQLIELIEDVIKRITKKIIQKEIGEQKELLIQCINELMACIKQTDGIVNVSISENDFQLIKNESEVDCAKFKIEPALSSGDFIIKSRFGEIRAILNERIEQLMRVEHNE